MGPPSGISAASLWDQAGGVLRASSVPTLGMLYPLSSDLFVDPSTGNVGVKTTTPQHAFHVQGQIVGGESTVVTGAYSTAVGGQLTQVMADFAAVLGGLDNRATGDSSVAVGGRHNRAQGIRSVVGGGNGNVASGLYATVPGGVNNTAVGIGSLAAGILATAGHDGAFVWSDNSGSFSSTGPDQFLVSASGGFGINDNAPAATLHVETGDIGASVGTGAAAEGVFVEGTEAVLTLASLDAGTSGSALTLTDFSGSVLQDNWTMYRRPFSVGGQLRFTYGASGNWTANPLVMELGASGNVGIGKTAGSVRLEVNGKVQADAFIQTSDARLKTDVRELDGALDAVRGLRGVRFRWDREQRPEAEQGDRIGLLAQEVREVVPEAVREAQDGALAVSYAELVPLLIEALKEQDAELTRTRERLARLEALARYR